MWALSASCDTSERVYALVQLYGGIVNIISASFSPVDEFSVRVPFLADVTQADNLFALGIGTSDATSLPQTQGLFVIPTTAVANPPTLGFTPVGPSLQNCQRHLGRKKKFVFLDS